MMALMALIPKVTNGLRKFCTNRPQRNFCTNRPNVSRFHNAYYWIYKYDIQICSERPGDVGCESRRYSTTRTVAGDDVGLESKSLYLCFQETDGTKTTHSIQAIRMSQLLGVAAPQKTRCKIRKTSALFHDPDYDFDLEFDEEEDDRKKKKLQEQKEAEEEEKRHLEKKRPKLEEMAIRRGPKERVADGVRSTVIGGSMIVFSGGMQDRNLSRVCGFETRTDVKIDPRRAFKHLPMIKNSPFLVELEGKLYRFGPSHDGSGSCFLEVMDKGGEGKWLPLDTPPPSDPPFKSYGYAVAGTNIFFWGCSTDVASRFDVSNPGKGWTQLIWSDWMRFFPVCNKDKLFIQLHDDDLGYLMLSYYRRYAALRLLVCVMSPGCDSSVPILNDEVPLSQFGLSFHEHEWWRCGHSFFHIQGRKFGLVLLRAERCECSGPCISCRHESVEVSVTTFDYQVIAATDREESSSSSSLDVKFKVTSCCLLTYTPSISPLDVELVGAHVL